MAHHTSTTTDFEVKETGFTNKLLIGMVLLALTTMVLAFVGQQVGSRIALGGHSGSTKIHEIVIGRSVLSIPENHIRFADQRRAGIMEQLELYALWPSMEGYSRQRMAAFNNQDGAAQILFISVTGQQMSRDMSGRFLPIYSQLIDRSHPVSGVVPGLEGYTFREEASVFANEELWIGDANGTNPFVARCLSADDAAAKASIAPCLRDIHLGNELSIRYRFSRAQLADWKTLDASIKALFAQFVRTSDQ